MRLLIYLTFAWLLGIGAASSLAQEAEPDDATEGTDTEAVAEAEDEDEEEDDPLIDLDDPDLADLDRQTYEEDDDDFVPTEEVPADEAIPFPTDI